jgi:gliding motility-associated-like protein
VKESTPQILRKSSNSRTEFLQTKSSERGIKIVHNPLTCPLELSPTFAANFESSAMHRLFNAILFVFLLCSFSVFSQTVLFTQSGNASDTWSYTSTGADPTAQAQALSNLNYTSAPQSLVVGGNTGGGSCIDGGSGNGPSEARTFTFESVDISNSNQFNRSLTFKWGNRHPVCTGTGWDTGENLIFTPIHNGVAMDAQTLAVGGNDAIFWIQNNTFTYTIPPCVHSFGFVLSIVTNRRDELLFLDDVVLTTPDFNVPTETTIVNQSICSNELPLLWNGLEINEAGSYNASIPTLSGCDSLVQLNLSILEAAESFQTLTICENELPYLLNGTEIMAAGLYQFSFLTATNCDSIANFTVNVLPSFQQNQEIVLCSDELPFTWQNQTITDAGNYTANLINAAGCDSTLNLTLVVNPSPEVDFSSSNTSVPSDNPVVDFEISTVNFGNSFWDFGDGTTASNLTTLSHTFPTEPGTYTVTLTLDLGTCTSSQSVAITVLENITVDFILPNVFSPNNDGINDVFSNLVNNAAAIQLEILNRWGALVFETDNPETGWNGKDQNAGNDCAEGVYFYKLTITNKANESETHHSFVHLVRQ